VIRTGSDFVIGPAYVNDHRVGTGRPPYVVFDVTNMVASF